MKTFPTLYKKNTQNKIKQWNIKVITTEDYPDIKIKFGELDGKQQTKTQTITEGKNIGKKNETSILEQAYAEAKARWEKQLKKGYVKTLQDAEENKTDEIIQGGVLPMLAHKFEDHKDKIKFPVYVQPKLDGERCIAIKQKGEWSLWTRTRKRITSCPHIIEQLHQATPENLNDYFLDGELYVHDANNFEKIMSAVRKQNPTPESELIEYHVYDSELLSTKAHIFADRNRMIFEHLLDWLPNIVVVPTFICPSLESVESMQKDFISQGYEGLMIRNTHGVYECKRSKNLLKMKTFDDAEFVIQAFEEGEDETVIAVCVMPGEKLYFRATMSGNKKDNQKYIEQPEKYIGKKLTVKYQGLTGANKVPRFPIGLKFRKDL